MTTTQHPGQAPVNTAALRLSRTPMDMAKAVLVLLVPVVVLVGVYVFFFGGSNVITVDTSGAFADARASAKFTVLQPAGLSKGWRALSAQYTPGTPSTLRIGYVAPDGSGVQLIESDTPADALIANELGNVSSVGPSVTIGGRTWGEIGNALVDTESGRTVIISGHTSEAELEQLASSLH